ncbi:CDP-archaeol synthase [uncultured Marinobacter sp.]|uniref:CDP-archaeol synthase n=1 Tax=uncultured Marinobacter sp. TaxID=187379 RepID=UPI0030D6F207
MTILWLFLLLALANGTPVIAHRLLRQRWNAPVDGGRLWRDGRPILGKSKTWRGLVVGITSCALLSLVTGFGALFGALFGTLALLGDLVSSFIKRRCGLAQSARATGLDQLPEAIVPMLFAAVWLSLEWLEALVPVVVFVAANMAISPLLFRLGIRKQPH